MLSKSQELTVDFIIFLKFQVQSLSCDGDY